MKVTVVAVGKLKERYLKEGIDEYKKRLSRFCDLDIMEVDDEQAPESISAAQELQIKKREADKIMKRIKDNSTLIVLDVQGKKTDSEGFANRLRSFFVSGSSHLVFVIGGSLGIDEELLKRADFRFSLSDLTFPHQLARLIFFEQLFRAFKIMNGEVYHK